jgi:hypothetical protein
MIIGPIVVLSIYVAAYSGVESNWGVPAIMIVMLGLIFYYLSSLKLILTKDRVIYRVMWRSNDIPIANIQAVERGRGPFGIGTTWIIRRGAQTAPLIVNVTNFDGQALHEFGHAIVRRGSHIRFSALRL